METLGPALCHVFAGMLAGVITGVLLKPLRFGVPGHVLAGIIGGAVLGYLANRYRFGNAPGALETINILKNSIAGAVGGAGMTVTTGLIRRVFPPKNIESL
ncbi:MAG: hypothetical protein AAF402_10125 [Pseudomonadota bacterium]